MLQKSKSITELYNEVKHFDYIITSDPALADALNLQITKPRLGKFATTPLKLAVKEMAHKYDQPIMSNDKLILEISKKHNIQIKIAVQIINKILPIWQQVGNLEKTGLYLQQDEKEFIKYLKEMPSENLAMQEYKCELKNIAVIGINLFNELDKQVLPKEYAKIDIFKKDNYELPAFYLFNSTRDVIDRIINIISIENQNDIALVVNDGSEYSTLLKAKLANKGISVISSEYISSSQELRLFLRLVEIGMFPHDLLVQDIMEIIHHFGLDIKTDYHNNRLDVFIEDNEDAKKIYDLILNIKKMKFSELAKEFKLSKAAIEFLTELYDKPITLNNYLLLRFFLENFDIAAQKEKQGILFTNPLKSVFINRPVIIYVGIDQSWTRITKSEDYIDKDIQDRINLESFQIMLQQGKKRFYFAAKCALNNNIIPCYFFNQLFSKKIETFEDKLFSPIIINNNYKEKEYKAKKQAIEADTWSISTFSASKFKEFYYCPKLYEINRLGSEEKMFYMEKGTILHDFGEFYTNHKEFVLKKGLKPFVEFMLEKIKNISSKYNRDVDYTEFYIAAQNLMAFIDEIELKNVPEGCKNKKHKENIFLEKYDLKKTINNTEHGFKDSQELKLSGFIDLMVSLDLVVDYKTGKRMPSCKAIIRKALPQFMQDEIDIQPLAYLCYMRKINPNKRIIFRYYYPLSNFKDVIEKNADINDNKIDVIYHPMSFNEFLMTEIGITALITNAPLRKFMEELKNEGYRELLSKLPINDKILLDDDSSKRYSKEFEKFTTGKGYSKKVTNLCGEMLKRAKAVRSGAKAVHLFNHDLDSFETLISEQIKKHNEYMQTGFPAEPLKESLCENCNANNLCIWRHDV